VKLSVFSITLHVKMRMNLKNYGFGESFFSVKKLIVSYGYYRKKMWIKSYCKVILLFIVSILLIGDFPIFTVRASPTLFLSKYSGNVGEEILVSGINFPPGIKTVIYWDVMNEEHKLNETYVKGDGTFSQYIIIPEDVVGLHWIIVEGTSANFTIKPKITLTPERGLPGDSITIEGKGFAANEKIVVAFGNRSDGVWNWSRIVDTNSSALVSNVNGSFSCEFYVPNAAYGNYIVNATDESLNFAEGNFTVGAVVSLKPTKGPSGMLVKISGRGFVKSAGSSITITINGTVTRQVSPIKTQFNGDFQGRFIVPTLDEGNYTVNVTDETGISSIAYLEVTDKTEISLSPGFGAPGDEIIIEGWNFTHIRETKVTVNFGPLHVKNFYTNSDGKFKGKISVPSLPLGIHNVTVTDENGLTATASFKIVVTGIIVSPAEGPAGTIVKIFGYGFTSGETATVTIGTKTVRENIDVDSVMDGTASFIIPTLPVGTYEVTVVDTEGLKASTTFKLTETTKVILTPNKAPYTSYVTIEAKHFTSKEGTSISFSIRNSTWEMTLTVSPQDPWTEVKTDENGYFKGTFSVPVFEDSKIISPGDYIIKAEDDNGLLAEVPFTILLPTIQVHPSYLEYEPGDTVSFYINCTFTYNFTIEIEDPDGILRELIIEEPSWQDVNGWMIVPSENASFILPSDAQLGEWKWKLSLDFMNLGGTFKVVEKVSLRELSENLTSISDKIRSLEGSLSSISKKLGEIDELNRKNLTETVNLLKESLDELREELSAVKSDVSEAKSSLANTQQMMTIAYIILASSIISAVVAVLMFIALIELGRMLLKKSDFR